MWPEALLEYLCQSNIQDIKGIVKWELKKHGSRVRCSSCKIVAHINCVSSIGEKVKFTCKPTFRDVGIRQYREHTCIHHHWAHRRSEKGKCKQCGKYGYSEAKDKGRDSKPEATCLTKDKRD
ncbi:hypothetical protein PGB90_004528 [Kerria lacca]